MVKENEIPEAVEYQLHRDGTVTNLRRDPKKVDRFRIEHKYLCPGRLSYIAVLQLPDRLRKVVQQRGEGK